MGLLMYSAHVHNLIHRKYELEKKLLDINKQYEDLHKYAERVGKGNMTLSDMLSMPSSMMGRAMNFIGFAHNNAMQYATTQGPQYEQWMMMQNGGMQDPQQAQMMHNYIMTQLYYQAREQAAELEKRNLNEIDRELQEQKEELETDLKIVEEELKTYKQQKNEAIKDIVPNFGNG